MIPWQIKNLLRSALESPNRRRAIKGYARIRRAGKNEPSLGFGGVLQSGNLIHGGAVKLLSLQHLFACDDECFDILYLVSSLQPDFAEDLASLCRIRGIKFVWNQNGVGYPAWAGGDTERHNAPMRRLRAQADFIIYQSEFCRESAQKFLGACEVPSQVLLNPVDLGRFSPGPEPLPREPLRLLSIGTQNYRERVVSVIECLRHLRDEGVDAVLTIAGPMVWKNAEGDVRRSIEVLRLRKFVKVLPPFRQDQAAAIYRDHHILVHPKYMDPCPTVVAEAIACGLPVVASRSGGIPEMVDEKCARLIGVPSSWDRMSTPSGRQLADAVKSIACELPMNSRLARQRAEKSFDQSPWLAQHADIFRSLLD
ncbi:MAG: glycosyltransferase family 4 protein [Chthoniobacterales bacterium]|nr:glycosyltransferase family 4 protein [Chthoniobacterales bacterium]